MAIGPEQVWGQFDGREDGRRAVGTTDDTERGGLFRREAHQDGYQQHGKDAELGGGPEDGQAQVAQHRTEVCQGAYSHEDDGWKETCLDEHVIKEVHQAEFMGDVVQRHFPDVGFAAVGQCDHPLRVRFVATPSRRPGSWPTTPRTQWARATAVRTFSLYPSRAGRKPPHT